MSRIPRQVSLVGLVIIGVSQICGCGYRQILFAQQQPRLTARPASPANMCEPAGIPFYLPKPLLVVAKNVYHIEEAKVGLTGTAPIPSGFDEQEGYGNVNMQADFSRSTSTTGPEGQGDPTADGGPTDSIAHSPTLHSTSIPLAPSAGGLPSDGLAPHTFFTYEIVFVPDLSQKYVLELRGGPGEMRAAMNLVNGWQFTGLGPYYMKDSSTAQNILSRGIAVNLGLGGVSDVINSVANLQEAAAGGAPVSMGDVAALVHAMSMADRQQTVDFSCVPEYLWRKQVIVHPDGTQEIVHQPPRLERYAEIHVYEAVLGPDGEMMWRPAVEHAFDREFLGRLEITHVPSSGDVPVRGEPVPPPTPEPPAAPGSGASGSGGGEINGQGDIQADPQSRSGPRLPPAGGLQGRILEAVSFHRELNEGLAPPLPALNSEADVSGGGQASVARLPVVGIVEPAAVPSFAAARATRITRDPELVRDVVRTTLQPQRPRKHGFLERICGHWRRVETREVTGTVASQ